MCMFTEEQRSLFAAHLFEKYAFICVLCSTMCSGIYVKKSDNHIELKKLLILELFANFKSKIGRNGSKKLNNNL
jgi:hypothetical protein